MSTGHDVAIETALSHKNTQVKHRSCNSSTDRQGAKTIFTHPVGTAVFRNLSAQKAATHGSLHTWTGSLWVKILVNWVTLGHYTRERVTLPTSCWLAAGAVHRLAVWASETDNETHYLASGCHWVRKNIVLISDRNPIICTLNQILLGRSNQGGWDWLGM
jgi:hypothetical protein